MKVKQYISTWSENYQLIFKKSRLLSQIPIFVILIVMLCESGDTLIRIIPNEDIPLNRIFEYSAYALVAIVPLSLRFLLLFSESKINFWLSQFFWITVFLWFGYYFTQRKVPPCLRTDEALMFFYLIGSSIRQIISLALSFFLKS